MPEQKNGKIIQSVQRAVDIINCFDDVNTEMSLSQISNRLGLNKSTVHGILNTLHNNNFIRQGPTGKYMLGQSLIRKYHFADSAKRNIMMEVSREGMEQIANKYHMNCAIFMMEFGALTLVNRIMPKNEMYTVSCISDSYINPLYCTASGRILLAYLSLEELEIYLDRHELIAHTQKTIVTREALIAALDNIRRVGFSVEDEELGIGVSALSVPIFDPTGKLFATISVSGMSFHLENRQVEMVTELKSLSYAITKKIF